MKKIQNATLSEGLPIEELRARVFSSVVAIILGSLIGYLLEPKVIHLLAKPIDKFYFFSPLSIFVIILLGAKFLLSFGSKDLIKQRNGNQF